MAHTRRLTLWELPGGLGSQDLDRTKNQELEFSCTVAMATGVWLQPWPFMAIIVG